MKFETWVYHFREDSWAIVAAACVCPIKGHRYRRMGTFETNIRLCDRCRDLDPAQLPDGTPSESWSALARVRRLLAIFGWRVIICPLFGHRFGWWEDQEDIWACVRCGAQEPGKSVIVTKKR